MENVTKALSWIGWAFLGWWLLASFVVIAFHSNAASTVVGLIGGAAIGHLILKSGSGSGAHFELTLPLQS